MSQRGGGPVAILQKKRVTTENARGGKRPPICPIHQNKGDSRKGGMGGCLELVFTYHKKRGWGRIGKCWGGKKKKAVQAWDSHGSASPVTQMNCSEKEELPGGGISKKCIRKRGAITYRRGKEVERRPDGWRRKRKISRGPTEGKAT